MAHFRGTLTGNRGEASRLGTKNSGLHGTANGWNVGVSFDLWYDEEKNEDTVLVNFTTGSSGKGTAGIPPLSLTYSHKTGELTFTPPRS